MNEDPANRTSTDDGRLSRRDYLLAAGGIGTGLTVGVLGRRSLPESSSVSSTRRIDPPEHREDFLWLGGSLWGDERVRDNLYAFARRHDLAVVLVKTPLGDAPADGEFGEAMVAASEFDLDVWLNVGLLNDLPAETFLADDAAREAHLEGLRAVARAHGDLFDSGRVVLWQEAPVLGQWVEGGDWTQAAVDNLLEYGPEIFAAQKRAIEEANGALSVGCFVHFPYVVDSKRPEVFESLAADLLAGDPAPDFGFVDFYRGWYEKDVGPEPANAAVRSLIANARKGLGDRPVFYLGQSHTINPNHTPSKQAMRMNLRASLESDAAGLGWYVRSGYVPTEQGFDPFVPNVAGANLDGDSLTTLTVARDRFLYPWLATLETKAGFEAEEAFDLWLVGDGFALHEHRLSVRTAGGEWEYVGDFGGYTDGDYPAGSETTDEATVFRALDRDRLLAGGTLDCRVETAEGSDETDLHSVLVMPCDPDAYVTEREAVALVRGDAALDSVSIGRTSDTPTLEPGGRSRVTVPVTDEARSSLASLRHPEHVDVIRRLQEFEEREDVDPDDRFDLWLRGSGLAEPSSLPSLVARDGTERSPADLGVVASTDAVAICHGLERDRFLGDAGLELTADTDASVEAAHAMPYAGSRPFRTPGRVADLLDEQPEEAETFCLAHWTQE